MTSVNWWIVALAFALGLVLTLAFMIRRVKREVPVYAAGGGTAAATLTGSVGMAKASADVDAPTAVIKTADTDVDAPTSVIRTVDADAETEAETEAEAPHGPGSAKPAADGGGPEGWLVKGNEDSMLYHSTESPHYDRTIAEVWFRDVETAEAAGFNRWDSGKSQRPKK